MADRIQLRRDIAVNWTSADPILAQGEIGIELDTSDFKIGDGITAWSSLPYVIGNVDDEYREFNQFIVTSPANKVYSLGFIAANDFAEVHINGILEQIGIGYTVSGSTVTIDNSVTLSTGDKIDVWYNRN